MTIAKSIEINIKDGFSFVHFNISLEFWVLLTFWKLFKFYKIKYLVYLLYNDFNFEGALIRTKRITKKQFNSEIIQTKYNEWRNKYTNTESTTEESIPGKA